MSFFITFEGIEGSGKSTQLEQLKNHLLHLGYQVVATREPGGCSISNTIRTLLLDPENSMMTARAELLLYSAARAQHVAEVIQPALQDGKFVLCDRFADATTIYQGVGRGLNAEQLQAINTFAANNISPDITLLLDYPVDSGLRRARQRNRDDCMEAEGRFELESLDFHEKIRRGYLDLASREKRFHVIDAVGSKECIAERIRTVVDCFLENRRPA